jgi:hypothetical protein
MRYLYWIHPTNYIRFWNWCFSVSKYTNGSYAGKLGFVIFGFEFIESGRGS